MASCEYCTEGYNTTIEDSLGKSVDYKCPTTTEAPITVPEVTVPEVPAADVSNATSDATSGATRKGALGDDCYYNADYCGTGLSCSTWTDSMYG